MTGRQLVAQVGHQLGELLGEVVGRRLAPVALQRVRGRGVGAGGAADAEIDAAGEEARQHAERLRDLQRAVVRQHHPAAAHPQRPRGRGDRADEGLGAGPGQHRAAVVLGDPVPPEAEVLGVPGEVDRVAECLSAVGPLGDGRLVEDSEPEGGGAHPAIVGPRSAARPPAPPRGRAAAGAWLSRSDPSPAPSTSRRAAGRCRPRRTRRPRGAVRRSSRRPRRRRRS